MGTKRPPLNLSLRPANQGFHRFFSFFRGRFFAVGLLFLFLFNQAVPAEEPQLSPMEIEKRLKEDPEDKEALNQLALHYSVEKEYLKAVDAYFKLIKVDPQNFHAYNNLGIIYKKVGQYKDSLFCYQKALQINPDYYWVHYNMGLAFEAMGRMQEARESYGRALSLNPEFAQALQRMRELSDEPGKTPALPEPVSAGQVLVVDPKSGAVKPLTKGGDKKAPRTEAKVVAEEPIETEAGSGVGKEGKGGKKPQEKRGGSEMVRTLRTGPGAVFYNKSMNALENDDLKTAIEQYVSCIMQDREFLGEPDNGLIQKSLQLLRDRPNSMSEGLFYRGYLTYLTGNTEGALADLKAYVEQNKKGPYRTQAETLIAQIETRLATARDAEASRNVTQRLATAPLVVTNATFTPRPDDTEIKKMSVDDILEEGKKLSREGRLRDAIATFKTGLDKDRENLPLLTAMANSYTDMMLLQGDNEAGKMARDLFEKILSLAPANSRESDLAKNMVKELNSRIK